MEVKGVCMIDRNQTASHLYRIPWVFTSNSQYDLECCVIQKIIKQGWHSNGVARGLKYAMSFATYLLALAVGLRELRSELYVTATVAVAVIATFVMQDIRGRRVSLKPMLMLDLALMISLIVVYSGVFGYFDVALLFITTPSIVILGWMVLTGMVAYSSVRLDRSMYVICLIFISFSVANAVVFGMYHLIDDMHTIGLGFVDEEVNFWIGQMLGATFVSIVAASFIAYRSFVRNKIFQIHSSCVLEESK